MRANPFSGFAANGNGEQVYTTADPISLAYLVFANATTSVVYRELDAAARAYLETGDGGPLLRLLAESYAASRSGGPGSAPASYSAGEFVAVSCSDYSQLYDMTLPPSARIPQRNAAFAEEQAKYPGTFAPFTIFEFAAFPLDSSVLDLCLTWPSPSPAYPPGQPVPPGAVFTSAPVLVLSGDLDSLTPAAQGAKAAALFPYAQQVTIENSFHVTAAGDEDKCASAIAVRFVRDLDAGDTSCARHIAEVHLVRAFVKSAAQLAPATAAAGNQGTKRDLQVAAAAAFTAGDVLARWWVNLSGSGVGLRGGNFSYNSPSDLTYFSLHGMKWVEDVAVSGTMRWAYTYPGDAVATATVSGAETGSLTIAWQSRVPGATATITGRIGGRKIVATMYAP